MSNATDPVSLKPKEIAPDFSGNNTQPEATPQPVTGGAIYFQQTNSPEAAQEPETPVGERTLGQLREFFKEKARIAPRPSTIEELHPSFQPKQTDVSGLGPETPTKQELASIVLSRDTHKKAA